MSELTDQQLISEYLAGNRQALDILIGRYLTPVYGFVFHYVKSAPEAEDITQDVFVKVWKKIKQYNPDKAFKTWVFTIAKNTAIDYLRRRKSVPMSAFEDEEGNNILTDKLADIQPLADEMLAKQDWVKWLGEKISQLSYIYREVLQLRYQSDFTLEEIAETLGESINTIKSRHRRALLALREIVDINDESLP